MIEYQEHCDVLGYEKISEEEVQEITRKKKELEDKYSKRYSLQYGWSCKIFEKEKMSFNRILRSIKLESWRPYYKLACNSVHSGPKSLFYNISTNGRNDMLLVGPSNSGFTDPAQLVSISLLQITSLLVNYAPTYERLVVMNALEKLNEEIPIEFKKIQNDIDREEKEKNA